MNILTNDLEALIDARIADAIHNLLNPTVEIVTTSNPIPKYATPGDAGIDIQADLWNIQEKFLNKALVIRKIDLLKEELANTEDPAARIDLCDLITDCEENPSTDTIAEIRILPGGQCLIPTGIYTAFPDLYEFQIRPRSGNALKYRITVTNTPGTIDARYKNEWGIIISNEGDKPFVIRQGDKIAQAVLALKCTANFVQKEKVEDLSGGDRGGGFGHTDASRVKL